MREWLTIELVLAILLVTSFTSIGALGLWAATSPKHWFLRTAAVVVALAAPLLIPAHEPILVFGMQTVLIVIFVYVWRWWTKRHDYSVTGPIEKSPVTEAKNIFRYSLTTLLLLTPLIAVIATIIAQIARHWPRQNFESASTLILNSVAGACSVLLAAWMFASGRKWVAGCVSLVSLILLSAVMAWFDWLFAWGVHYQSWPPDPQTFATVFGLIGGTETHPQLVWFAVLPAISVATWLVVYLASHAESNTASEQTDTNKIDGLATPRRVAAAYALGVLLIFFAAFPATFFWKLLHPLPMPKFETPEPNGAADIVAAGRAFEKSPILSTTVEPTSTDELAAEIAKYAASYDRLRLGLSRAIRARSWPHDEDLLMKEFDLSLDTMQGFRAAARGLMREAELATQQGRHGDAAAISIENLRLGQAVTRDGLLVDYLVGIAIEGIGESTLYPAISKLNGEQCRETIAALSDLERDREPVEDAVHRDRIWTQRASGWTGHFFLLLSDLEESSTDWQVHPGLNRTEAVQRLLAVELAVRAFQIEHGELPARLEMLTSEFLARPPVDPFDPSGRPLRYVRTTDGYVVYSVGFDGADNGGAPPSPSPEARAWWDESTPADLRLDHYFAPDQTIDGATGDQEGADPLVDDDLN